MAGKRVPGMASVCKQSKRGDVQSLVGRQRILWTKKKKSINPCSSLDGSDNQQLFYDLLHAPLILYVLSIRVVFPSLIFDYQLSIIPSSIVKQQSPFELCAPLR